MTRVRSSLIRSSLVRSSVAGSVGLVRPLARLLVAASVTAMLTISAPALADRAQSDKYYQDALEWLQKGDPRAAVIQLRNAVREDGENYSARFLLGRLYLETGNVPGAKKELEVAHRNQPSDESEVFLGRAMLGLREFDNVLKTVREHSDDPTFQTLKTILRSEALFATEQYDEADREITALLEVDDSHPSIHLLRARIATKRKDREGAERAIDAALARKPDLVEAYLLRAQLAYEARDMDRVLQVVGQAMEANPDDPRPLMMQAEALVRRGDALAAQKLVGDYLVDNPNDIRAIYLNARILATLGQYEDADRDLRKISEAVRQLPAASLLAGVVKYQLEQYAQAEEFLKRYVSAAGLEGRQARRLLASVQMRTLRPRAALQTLEPMIEAGSRDIASLQLAASAYLRTGQLDQARATFARVVQGGSAADRRQAQAFLVALQSATTDITGKLTLDETSLAALKALDQLRHGEEQAALDAALALQAAEPTNPTVANLLAGIYIGRSELDKARAVLMPAFEADPNHFSTLRNLDRIDIAEGNFDSVEARLRTSVENNPDNEAMALRLAQFLSQRGRGEEAVQVLTDQAEKLPEATLLRRNLVSANLQLGNQDAAKRFADELRQIGMAGDQRALDAAGQAYMAVGDYQSAIAIYDELAGTLDDPTGAQLRIARAQFLSNDLAATKATLNGVLAANPTNVVANNSMIELHIREQDAEAAMAVANKVMEQNKALGVQLRADVFRRTNRIGSAVEELKALMAEQPSSGLVRLTFRTMVQADQKDEAISLMTSWLNDHPDDPDSLQMLSAVQIQDGEFEAAASLLERAYSLLPNNPLVLNNLAWLRYELKRPGALTMARRAFRMAPQSPEVADTLGWILVKEGDMDQALRLLYAANDAAPDNRDIAYHLAFALNEAGKPEEARALLERTLNKDQASDPFFEQEKAQELMQKLQQG